MQISRNIANGPKSNNQVLVGTCVIVCIQKPSHHILQTFRPLRMFKITFRDSSLYPKQLSIFCLLWLISANVAKTLVWKTCMWLQIMTSQTTHTKYKWHHTPLNETPPWKFSAYATASEIARSRKFWARPWRDTDWRRRTTREQRTQTCRVYMNGSQTRSPHASIHPKCSWQISMVFKYQASFQKKSTTYTACRTLTSIIESVTWPYATYWRHAKDKLIRVHATMPEDRKCLEYFRKWHVAGREY